MPQHVQRATLLSHSPAIIAARAPVGPAPDQRQAEIERELRLARDLQQGLLLEAVPHLPGWELHAVSLPAQDLGGDLYDFLPISAAHHGLMIGDVSGKGMAAALRMAVARTVFRYAARQAGMPGETLANVNRDLLREIPHGMVTMIYAQLDVQRGELRLANAGHNYPIVINGAVEEIELTGMPLGVDDESSYTERKLTLAPGDSVLLYTDGVTEAISPSGELFGDQRLAVWLAEHARHKPRALIARLLQELRGWSAGQQSDDLTLVALRRRLARLDAELLSIVDDLLTPAGAAILWHDHPPLASADPAEWLAVLPTLIRITQTQFGRGPARELHAQLRLVIDEYRLEP